MYLFPHSSVPWDYGLMLHSHPCPSSEMGCLPWPHSGTSIFESDCCWSWLQIKVTQQDSGSGKDGTSPPLCKHSVSCEEGAWGKWWLQGSKWLWIHGHFGFGSQREYPAASGRNSNLWNVMHEVAIPTGNLCCLPPGLPLLGSLAHHSLPASLL